MAGADEGFGAMAPKLLASPAPRLPFRLNDVSAQHGFFNEGALFG